MVFLVRQAHSEKQCRILSNVGTPQGISASHNFIEADASNTRDDVYVTGDAATMNMTLFMNLYNAMEDGVFTHDQVGAHIAKRLEESKASNPYFYSGPYTGAIGRNAGYAFASRLLSNHTADNPMGLMSTFDNLDTNNQNRRLIFKQQRKYSSHSGPFTTMRMSLPVWCTRKATNRSPPTGIVSPSTTLSFNLTSISLSGTSNTQPSCPWEETWVR